MHWAKIHASQGKLWTHWRNQKKNQKSTRTSPIMPTPPPFSAATIFCVYCRTVDLITHARFQVNRFRRFGATGGRKWPSPIDLAHRPYNSVRTNVLHCDKKIIKTLPCGMPLITLIHNQKCNYHFGSENCNEQMDLPDQIVANKNRSNLACRISDKCLTMWHKIFHFTSYIQAPYFVKLSESKLWQNTNSIWSEVEFFFMPHC